MRFKAKLSTEQVSLLLSIITPISKLASGGSGDNNNNNTSGSRAVLYFDPEYLRISTTGGNDILYNNADYHLSTTKRTATSTSGITCFAELNAKDGMIFLEQRIESAADNVIVMEIDLISLKLALQSVLQVLKNNGGSYSSASNNYSNNNNNINRRPSHDVILKLAKRNGNMPCLCLDGVVATTTNNSNTNNSTTMDGMEIHQAIPVRIMRADDMVYHLPPQINMPTVQLELPCNNTTTSATTIGGSRPLRAVVDKLRSMGPHIYLEGSMKGDLTVRLDNEGASLACFYHQLTPCWENDHDHDETTQDDTTITTSINNNNDDQMDEADITTTTINDERRTNHNRGSQNQLNNNNNNASRSCTIKVDAYKLWTCLQWQQQQSQQQQQNHHQTRRYVHNLFPSFLLGMVENEMLVIHVQINPSCIGFFTYYIPVHFLDEHDDYYNYHNNNNND